MCLFLILSLPFTLMDRFHEIVPLCVIITIIISLVLVDQSHSTDFISLVVTMDPLPSGEGDAASCNEYNRQVHERSMCI